jgi:hypothetical protein
MDQPLPRRNFIAGTAAAFASVAIFKSPAWGAVKFQCRQFHSQRRPFYARWKQHFGTNAWNLLEAQIGKLG